jgi:hypothetical protein
MTKDCINNVLFFIAKLLFLFLNFVLFMSKFFEFRTEIYKEFWVIRNCFKKLKCTSSVFKILKFGFISKISLFMYPQNSTIFSKFSREKQTKNLCVAKWQKKNLFNLFIQNSNKLNNKFFLYTNVGVA